MAYCLRTKQILPCCSPCLTVEKQCLLIGSLVKSEVTESETEQFPGSSEFLHLNLSLSVQIYAQGLVTTEHPLITRLCWEPPVGPMSPPGKNYPGSSVGNFKGSSISRPHKRPFIPTLHSGASVWVLNRRSVSGLFGGGCGTRTEW